MVALSGSGWALAPSLDLFVDEADDVFPHRDTTSDGSIGDTAHAARESDHNPYDAWVHAVDLDENLKPGVTLEPMWRHLIAVRDKRVRYLIYEGRIVKSYTDSSGHPAWKPYPYTGINDHSHHLHVSIEREATARNDLRPWGFAVAYAAPAAPRPAPIAPAPHTQESRVVLITQKSTGNLWLFEEVAGANHPKRRTLISDPDDKKSALASTLPRFSAENPLFGLLIRDCDTYQ